MPSADAGDVEAADDAGDVAPVLLLLLLLQPAATRARTLSPAAAITRFMGEIPPLLGGSARRAAGPAGDRALLRPGSWLEVQGVRQAPENRRACIIC